MKRLSGETERFRRSNEIPLPLDGLRKPFPTGDVERTRLREVLLVKGEAFLRGGKSGILGEVVLCFGSDGLLLLDMNPVA